MQSPSRLPEMDPAIWSRLPEELLEHVLSFLPVRTFLNLRSTCKHFKSLLFSPSFMSRHTTPGSPFSSFLLLSHPQFYQQFPLYDSISGSWRHLTLLLSFLLPVAGSNGSPTCTLLSSSNGLFCFSLPSSYSLLVCNFLAKSSRIVEFPSYPFSFDSLTFVSRPFGYKIFVLCSKFSSNSVFVYDSKIHSWQKFGPFEPILGDDYRQEGVLFDGSLYFTTSEPFSIACFDLESGRWERLDSELPGDLAFVRLVSDGENKLYLIGGVGRNGISRGVKLWELGGGRNWIEVESLPEMMCKKFVSVCYHNYERVYCFWHQGMICICCYTCRRYCIARCRGGLGIGSLNALRCRRSGAVASGGFLLFQTCMLQSKASVSVSWSMCEGVKKYGCGGNGVPVLVYYRFIVRVIFFIFLILGGIIFIAYFIIKLIYSHDTYRKFN